MTDLRLSQVLLSEGEIPLNENLESIFIDTPKLTFSGEFTLPKLAKKFTINADHLTFKGQGFERVTNKSFVIEFKGIQKR